MKLPVHKTKIICTMGPACRVPSVLESMMESGMNVARLNFSHGSFPEHQDNIRLVREAAAKTGKTIGIMADLPGVKMRIGKIKGDRIILKKGDKFTLTTKSILGTSEMVSVSYKKLPQSVVKGGIIYLSDGFLQLKVEQIRREEIVCRVIIGGPLLSHKGVNLPGAKLDLNPITAEDLRDVDFCLKHGVSAFALSFILKAADVRKVREHAAKKRRRVFLVAKIERREAIHNFDEILAAADAVMIARGDLGIEIPIEEVPSIQKDLIRRANIVGRPVITATQMLGSMTQNIRPTRAEVNDVANAIADGTDAVMLSEETAIGEYPVDTVQMMAKIAMSTEHLCHTTEFLDEMRDGIRSTRGLDRPETADVISLNVVRAANKMKSHFILTQTSSGTTARHISRFKPRCWILAFCVHAEVCGYLSLSYGVHPLLLKRNMSLPHIIKTVRDARMAKKGDIVILTERRFSNRPGVTDSMAIVTID